MRKRFGKVSLMMIMTFLLINTFVVANSFAEIESCLKEKYDLRGLMRVTGTEISPSYPISGGNYKQYLLTTEPPISTTNPRWDSSDYVNLISKRVVGPVGYHFEGESSDRRTPYHYLEWDNTNKKYYNYPVYIKRKVYNNNGTTTWEKELAGTALKIDGVYYVSRDGYEMKEGGNAYLKEWIILLNGNKQSVLNKIDEITTVKLVEEKVGWLFSFETNDWSYYDRIRTVIEDIVTSLETGRNSDLVYENKPRLALCNLSDIADLCGAEYRAYSTYIEIIVSDPPSVEMTRNADDTRMLMVSTDGTSTNDTAVVDIEVKSYSRTGDKTLDINFTMPEGFTVGETGATNGWIDNAVPATVTYGGTVPPNASISYDATEKVLTYRQKIKIKFKTTGYYQFSLNAVDVRNRKSHRTYEEILDGVGGVTPPEEESLYPVGKTIHFWVATYRAQPGLGSNDRDYRRDFFTGEYTSGFLTEIESDKIGSFDCLEKIDSNTKERDALQTYAEKYANSDNYDAYGVIYDRKSQVDVPKGQIIVPSSKFTIVVGPMTFTTNSKSRDRGCPSPARDAPTPRYVIKVTGIHNGVIWKDTISGTLTSISCNYGYSTHCHPCKSPCTPYCHQYVSSITRKYIGVISPTTTDHGHPVSEILDGEYFVEGAMAGQAYTLDPQHRDHKLTGSTPITIFSSNKQSFREWQHIITFEDGCS